MKYATGWIHFSCCLLVYCLSCLTIPDAMAEKVIAVRPDGAMSLSDGRKIELCGIALSSEGISLLRLLLAGKDIDLQKEKDLPQTEPIPFYVYVDTKEIDLPFQLEVHRDSKVMVNEILLSMGAARVDDKAGFGQLNHFKEVENHAKEKGEGIWSYEVRKSLHI